MKTKFVKELPLIFITLVPLVFLFVNWNALPAQLPMHWNANGEIDNYGPRYMPALLCIGLYLLFIIVPRIDPRKRNYDLFAGTYYKLRLVLALFFSAISVVTMMIGLGAGIQMHTFIMIGISILFTMMGNYMSTIRPNYFLGIRTPWTLDNEEVWKRTHLLGGRLWFWGGIACLIASFSLPQHVLTIFFIAAVVIISLLPIIYSYLLFRKLKSSHS